MVIIMGMGNMVIMGSMDMGKNTAMDMAMDMAKRSKNKIILLF